MTPEELRELNRRVATEVMGWKRMAALGGDLFLAPDDPTWRNAEFTTPAGCELVKTRLRELGWFYGSCIGAVDASSVVSPAPHLRFERDGETEYIALCKAALATVRGSNDEEL